MRKPGGTEGKCATVQRTLRDDSVVVRIDGMIEPTYLLTYLPTYYRYNLPTYLPTYLLQVRIDGMMGESTVDPSPLAVVRTTNPRHGPTTRFVMPNPNPNPND